MANSADPDVGFFYTIKGRVYPGSAGQGLICAFCSHQYIQLYLLIL